MTTSTYQTTLSNAETDGGTYSISLQAGQVSLSVVFTWPDFLQEKYDEILRGLTADMQGDPLVGVNSKITNYDIIDYYCTQMPYPVTLAWIASQDLLPVTIRNAASSVQLTTLSERQETYRSVKAMKEMFEAMLAWNVKITDSSNNVVTGYVRPGGFISAKEQGWGVRFLTESVPSVAKDALNLLVIQVEVYEND